MVTWMYLRTKNFWDCVAAHAITNLLLGLYDKCIIQVENEPLALGFTDHIDAASLRNRCRARGLQIATIDALFAGDDTSANQRFFELADRCTHLALGRRILVFAMPVGPSPNPRS